jgi:heptosyltransferase I
LLFDFDPNARAMPTRVARTIASFRDSKLVRPSSFEFRHTPPRVLIIKPSAIGDVVHALPVLNLLRRKWPAAHTAWLVMPVAANLLEGHPQLDEVILFDRRQFSRAWRSPRAMLALLRFTRSLRDRFDLVIDLQGLFRSGWLAGRTGAAARIGFANAREFAWAFYTRRFRIDTIEQHAIDRYLKLAAAVGCETEPVEFVFATTPEDRAYAQTLAPNGAPYAVLMPGTNWPTKRWPIERFAAMVAPLRARFGLQSLIAGGPGDIELAREIPGAIDLTGKTTLRQLTALLERADLVIANDSGPMHIAAALGRPLVTAFGPTNPIRTGPYRRDDSVIRLDIPCSPCYSRGCSHQSCLQLLEIEPVLTLAEEQMARYGRSPGKELEVRRRDPSLRSG